MALKRKAKKIKVRKIPKAKLVKEKKRKSVKKIAKGISNLIPSQNQIDWTAETARLIAWIGRTRAKVAYVDLFCGFGGTTAGVSEAKSKKGEKFAVVILGINHDDIALACHKVHNPHTLHLREDIRKVMLEPIKKMIAEIRKAHPHLKIKLWTSAECTHHSRAKGGDSRDPDSRSLAEEIYRYEDAIKPDMIQVENVTEFRTWGPLIQKQFDVRGMDFRKLKRFTHPEFGVLYAKSAAVWINKEGFAFKKNKKHGYAAWMVPDPEHKAEYFNQWINEIKALGYKYDDRDINAADHGAFTARIRYYGQFSKSMPIIWPDKTHTKDVEKHFLKFGARLLKHKAVREVLDFGDTGDSIFVPGRIKSDQTFKRLTEGGIKHIAGGKQNHIRYKAVYDHWLATGEILSDDASITPDEFLIKYNSSIPADNNYKHSIVDVNGAAPTIPCRNMLYKPHFDFMVKHFGGDPKDKSYSLDGPAHTVTNKDHNAKVHADQLGYDFMMKYYSGKPEYKNYSVDGPAHTLRTCDGQAKVHAQVLPFIIQFNNNCDLNSVNEPSKTLTNKEKFGTASFIQQRHNGNPQSRIVDVNGPARTITSTGGNQDLVQVEQILPYLSIYHGNGDNCHSINESCPVVPSADTHAIVTPQPFIFRQFSSGGETRSTDEVAGSLLQVPKMNLISPMGFKWIMDTNFKNVGNSIEEPSKVVTADRHHAYIVNPSYFGCTHSTENPSPVVVASQHKAPLHLAQVEYGDQKYFGIVIYNTDSEEIKELKYFMAIYGIVDIKMRMLKEIELLPIQGFPVDYIQKAREMGIHVTGTNAKKYIGNSQEVTTARCLMEGYENYIYDYNNVA